MQVFLLQLLDCLSEATPLVDVKWKLPVVNYPRGSALERRLWYTGAMET